MYKLIGHSLEKDKWFEPESQPFTLQERDSVTTITLGPGAPSVGFGDWILDDGWPEGNYVWRVKNVDDVKNTETRTVELESVIKSLDDQSLFNEVTTKMLANDESATTVTAKKAIKYLLALQSDWVLGNFDYESVTNPYEFDGDTILDAIETISETLDDCVWEYDFSVYPFKLHILQRSDAVSWEMREGRNLSTLKKNVSRSGMYTRIYPVGKNDLHIDGDYLSRHENTYGRIDKIETDQSKTTKENLRAWALARLKKHSEPTVSITISGLELSAETGENLDRLKLNKVGQVPLPEFGTTIEERIVKLQWRDRIKEPENVTVTLCNSSADVATIIRQQSRGGGKAAKGQAKQNYLFEANGEHLLYEVFDECGHLHGLLRMTEESLRIAFDNEINSVRSEFNMTAESLRISFENDLECTRSEFLMTAESLRISFENDLSSTRSEFLMTAESLRISFENDLSSTRSEFLMTSESLRVQFENDLSSTRSEFLMTAESLRIDFENDLSSTRSEFNMTAESLRISFESDIASARSEFSMTAESLRVAFESEAGSIRSEMAQTANEWSVKISGVTGSDGKVTVASIVAGINAQEGSSYVKLQADKIDLSGYVTMTSFNATKGKVDNLTGGTIVEGFCKASLVVGTTVTANTTFTHAGDTIYKRSMKWTSGGSAIATVHATGDTTSIILNHSHDMTVDSSGNVTVGDAQTTTGTFNIADTAFYKARVASAWNSGGATAKADQASQYAPYGGSVVIKIQYVDNEGTTKDTGRSVTIWNTSCSHAFGDLSCGNGTYYPSTYGWSGFSKVVANCGHTFGTKSISSNGTFYASTDGYSGFSSVTVSGVGCTHTFGELSCGNGTYYPSTYGYSGFSKVVADCGHSFKVKSISSNGTFKASDDGVNGYSRVTVSGVRTTEHKNCADSLTRKGVYAVLYAPDDDGATISVKLKNISAAGRCWYYRSSSQSTFTAYTES